MSTVSLGPTMPMLSVELTRNRPWRSRKGVALRSQSGTPMPWPAAPQLIFSNGTTVGFALSSDSLLATPATALSAAQVDEIIDSGSAIISLIDPGSGVPWAHGRYSVHYGAGTGGTGNISTSGESVVIIADRIEVIGGGGGGGLTQAQAEEVARDAVGAALVAGTGIGIAVDDAADTITITSTAGSDATTATKGVVQLAGDLGGTASAPTVPGLAGKANTSHTHAAGDTTSGTFAIARIPTGTTSTTVALGNHTHNAADLSGVVKTVNGTAPDGAGNVTVSGGSAFDWAALGFGGADIGADVPMWSIGGHANYSLVAGRLAPCALLNAEQVTVDAVDLYVETPAAGATLSFALYTWMGAGESSTLVASLGTASGAASGRIVSTFAPRQLAPGPHLVLAHSTQALTLWGRAQAFGLYRSNHSGMGTGAYGFPYAAGTPWPSAITWNFEAGLNDGSRSAPLLQLRRSA